MWLARWGGSDEAPSSLQNEGETLGGAKWRRTNLVEMPNLPLFLG
jgi:hypothetical protein